ncbi:MAG: hypothetical protein Rubg2KO_28150 [Rubricoccaceae bacterium]
MRSLSILPLLFVMLTLAACAGPSRTSTNASLSGTVTYLQRIALPPDATVHVALLDVSLADASSETLAETSFPTDGAQVPLPYTLTYDASDVDPRRRYVVRAEIRSANGELMWTTDTAHPVLTNGASSDSVEIRVVQVHRDGTSAGATASASLVGPTWNLVRIDLPDGGRVPLGPNETSTVSFQETGRFGGTADCNSYGGLYTAAPDGGLSFSQTAVTQAMCLPPSAGEAMTRSLSDVETYELTGQQLRLMTSDGRVLTFELATDDMGSMQPQPTGEALEYACDMPDGESFTFTIKTGPGEIALWLPERFEGRDGGTYRVLGQVRAASGAKYQDGDVMVWTKNDEALLEVDGASFAGCNRGA